MNAITEMEAFESISPAEIAKSAQMFESLKQLRLKLGSGKEEVLERAFELHVQGVLEKLQKRLSENTEPHQQNVEAIMARHGLYDATFQQIALLCQSSKLIHHLSYKISRSHVSLVLSLSHIG